MMKAQRPRTHNIRRPRPCHKNQGGRSPIERPPSAAPITFPCVKTLLVEVSAALALGPLSHDPEPVDGVDIGSR